FNNFLKIILLLGDVVLMYSALLLTLALRYWDFTFLPGPWTRIFLIQFSIIYLFWLLILFAFDFYEISYVRKVFDFFRNLALFALFATGFGIAYFYLQPQLAIAPKTILFLHILIFGLLFCGWRYFFSYILKLKNLKEKIIIVGEQKEIKEILPKIPEKGYEIVGFFNTQTGQNNSFLDTAKYGIISEISELKQIIEKEKVDLIVFTSEFYKNKKLIQQFFSKLPFNLNYINFIDFYEILTQKALIDTIDEVWFLENIFKKQDKINEILKRGFDVIFSFLGVLITMILFPFIALIIKFGSSGPVFYAQKRVGKDGKIFTLYKFRTMVVGAEKNGPRWTVENDPRIIRFGKFLRATHLDELPQFYNIFKGDISFVGPRPESLDIVSHVKKQIPYYEIRHFVKPGLTGWAQIKFPASASVKELKEKLKYELYYIKNQSFIFDVAILLKTIQFIFRK
ncbi:sugar transferase, partial [Thermodesulfovibrionales bacterium]|nr:sugar transferase [Thermodesulfovibrionales bacterium]